MNLKDVISQLESIRANSESFLDPLEPDSIWKKDMDALDEVLAILKKMAKQNWWERLLFRVWYTFVCKL